ncbi:MAG: UDP-2,3-diacylglucosamine diphosphatase LpxI [Phycisphaerales bacterium]|nr:UDP-2,3-diacylglucosamine diphosphatase LpxI [Phycisphaerales bacterium]
MEGPRQGDTAGAAPSPIGLIAGGGRLPILVADGMKRHGHTVHSVGLAGFFDPALPTHCDTFHTAGFLQIGRWARLLRRCGVSQAILVGRVGKTRMYDPLIAFRQMPDWRAAMIWYRRLHKDRRSAPLLSAVADALDNLGVTLIDSTRHIPEHMASPGLMTARRPTDRQQRDIEFGWPLLCAALSNDFGQAMTVCDGDVIAVEAIEGTDRMIQRTGDLCPKKGWTLLKGAKRGHDLRADVPAIGVQTVENVQRAGGRCIAVAAGDVIIIDKPDALKRADELGIAVVGVVPPWTDQDDASPPPGSDPT